MSARAIRPAREADLPRLHALCVAAFVPIHAGFAAVLGPRLFAAHYDGWEAGYARTLGAMLAADSRERLHVLEEAGVVAGFVATIVEPGSGVGEIGLMAVDPARQRRGIGRALVAFALDEMRARGATSAHVGTGDDAAHAPARALYAALGFGRAIPSVHLHREL